MILMENSKEKKFMEALQAGIDHVNVIGLMDIDFHLADFVDSKTIVSIKCNDDEHCMWKSAMSHLVTVVQNLKGVQFESKSCIVLQNDAIIRTTGQIIPTIE